jgi:cytosine/adenosine deaminase-related metal-dependent hydrolase
MIILKDAYVFSFSKNREFARYYILINENKITDMVNVNDELAGEKMKAWTEKYGSSAEVIDCSSKIVMPPFINSCVKSEGSLINYLLRNRHYEVHDGDLYTDLIFNYIYQELENDEIREDLKNIYTYSFARNLKAGITCFNEFSLRKDANHVEHIAQALKITGQSASVCYPVRQELETLNDYKHLNPAYYLTDENQLTIYDITNITELRNHNVDKLFLEVATNKEVADSFRLTFQKPVIKYLDEYGLIDSKTFLINPLYLSYDEMKIIREKGASVIVCPRDLLYFTHRYFPIDDFINFGIKYTIGTGWLGEDLFKDLRFFRNKYKELNLSSVDLLKAITTVPHDMFFSLGTAGEEVFSIDVNKNADMVFVDLSDVRFQFFPESTEFEDVADFIVDNLSNMTFSDIMIGGKFKVRRNRLVNIDEDELIKSVTATRERLYRIGKYEELSERRKLNEKAQELELGSRDEEEIRLFSDSEAREETEILGDKTEFRIKARITTSRRKVSQVQKNLFEEFESDSMVQSEEYRETPEFNLLYTEIKDVEDLEGEVLQSKIVDEKIIKQVSFEKKPEKKKSPPIPESKSKIELPKNVKLRFGDD